MQSCASIRPRHERMVARHSAACAALRLAISTCNFQNRRIATAWRRAFALASCRARPPSSRISRAQLCRTPIRHVRFRRCSNAKAALVADRCVFCFDQALKHTRTRDASKPTAQASRTRRQRSLCSRCAVSSELYSSADTSQNRARARDRQACRHRHRSAVREAAAKAPASKAKRRAAACWQAPTHFA